MLRLSTSSILLHYLAFHDSIFLVSRKIGGCGLDSWVCTMHTSLFLKRWRPSTLHCQPCLETEWATKHAYILLIRSIQIITNPSYCKHSIKTSPLTINLNQNTTTKNLKSECRWKKLHNVLTWTQKSKEKHIKMQGQEVAVTTGHNSARLRVHNLASLKHLLKRERVPACASPSHSVTNPYQF